MKYNFDDFDFQIELNESRLNRERERYADYRNRITIISLFYTVYAAFTIQLFKFGFIDGYIWQWFFGIPFLLFILSFLLSVYFTIRLLIPKKLANMDLPTLFYNRVRKMYVDQGDIPENDIKYYLRATYKDQLEQSVEKTFKLCNKQSKFHYWSLVFALCALIPYMTCVGVKLTKGPEDITKVEIVKPQKDSDMAENENPQANSGENKKPSSEEPKVDPAKVIKIPPQMIKEGYEIPDSRTQISDEKSDTTSKKSKE